MTLPLHSENGFGSKKRLISNHSQFIEGWAGVGIWAVIFGIIASGILKL